MGKKNIIEKLEKIGLSHKEALVYETLLKHGYTKAGNIPGYTKLKRGIVYKILDDLVEKGFVKKHGEGTAVTRYAPLSPEKLYTLIEEEEKKVNEKKNTFEEIYGNLKSQFNLLSGKPSVQYFEGKEQVKKMLEDSLYTEEIMYTYADVDAVEKYFAEINKEHVQKRKAKGIQKHILVPDSKKARKAKKMSEKDPLTEIRIIPEKKEAFGGVAEMYDNKTVYISISDVGLSGILIEDKQITKMNKFIFESLWEQAE